MSPLDAWREELRRLIPRGFLRRDQGSALFVSDSPRFGGADETARALKAAGYTVQLKNGLMYLDAGLEKYRALAAAVALERPAPTDGSLFLYSLADRLLRFGGEITEENLPLARLTLKALDADDLPGLDRLLPPAVAEAQRKHILPPKAAGQLILSALNQTELERSVSPC